MVAMKARRGISGRLVESSGSLLRATAAGSPFGLRLGPRSATTVGGAREPCQSRSARPQTGEPGEGRGPPRGRRKGFLTTVGPTCRLESSGKVHSVVDY